MIWQIMNGWSKIHYDICVASYALLELGKMRQYSVLAVFQL